MAIKKYTPTTNGRRGMSTLVSSEITASTPEKSLVVSKTKTGGRNNQGRMTVRHIGGGVKQKYRLIDFPLSNCTNSGIDTVGVLTQYQPLVLNEYIGNGQPWDLDKMNGGVHVLPPYETQSGASWYEGTANAIYQNIGFIERYDPEYVVVLGGDHIYKMDYSKMVDFHVANNADCTISVIDVPKAEASRFGITICDEKKQIVDFVEKPKEPKSTLASMGIYVFSWEKLKEYLIENENEANAKRGEDVMISTPGSKVKVFVIPTNEELAIAQETEALVRK